MAPHPILIIGASGSGKSTSIRDLSSKETFLFNVCKKSLPFKGANKLYTEAKRESNPNGNQFTTDDYSSILRTIYKISQSKPDITNIVIDDSQYIILNEFMRRHSSSAKGKEVYELFNDIADHFWHILWDIKGLRDDLFIFFLHHTEMTEYGNIVPKSIGKLLSEKIDIAGMFTIVLLAKREGDSNFFVTQNDGSHPAKTPIGMFDTPTIPNNLQLVKDAVLAYYKGDNNG